MLSAVYAAVPKAALAAGVVVLAALLVGQTMVAHGNAEKLSKARETLATEKAARATERAAAAEAAASAVEAFAAKERAWAAQQGDARAEHAKEIERLADDARRAAAAADRLRNALRRAASAAGGGAAASGAASAPGGTPAGVLEAVAAQCSERYRALDAVAQRIHATQQLCQRSYDALTVAN